MIVATGPVGAAGSASLIDVLRAAGVPILGEAFPGTWSEAARENVGQGYFGALSEQGIYYKTNPDPGGQAYLDAAEAVPFALFMRPTAVLRTERAYLDRVVASLPHYLALGADPEDAEAVLLWWNDVFVLLRDAATRRYPLRLVSDEALARDPEGTVRATLAFLGVEATEDAIERGRAMEGRPRHDAPEALGIPVTILDVFDELHRRVDCDEGFDRSFLEHLYAVNEALTPHVLRLQVASLRSLAMNRKRRPEGDQ